MNTKYLKVPVSERLPEKDKRFLALEYNSRTEFDIEWMIYDSDKEAYFYFLSDIHTCEPEYWLEEVPDHSEEMLFIMKQMDDIINKLQWPDDMAEEISQLTSYYHELINKVKDNASDNK